MRSQAWPTVLLFGAFGGAFWGIHARLWMRYISAHTEFSWEGTLFIVAAFSVAGIAQTAVLLARRAGMRRRLLTVVRVVGLFSLLPLAFGGGAILFPAIIFTALALGHGDWTTKVRLLLAAAAGIQFVGLISSLLSELPTLQAIIGTLWAAGIYFVISWAACATLGAANDGWRAPRWLYVAGVLGLVALALLTSPILIGAT